MMDEPAAMSDLGHHDAWQEPPTWPKPVGIISIVWGAVGLTCAGCGVASFFMNNLMSGMIPPEMGPMPAVMQPDATQLALQAVNFLWTILLIVAGIMS